MFHNKLENKSWLKLLNTVLLISMILTACTPQEAEASLPCSGLEIAKAVEVLAKGSFYTDQLGREVNQVSVVPQPLTNEKNCLPIIQQEIVAGDNPYVAITLPNPRGEISHAHTLGCANFRGLDDPLIPGLSPEQKSTCIDFAQGHVIVPASESGPATILSPLSQTAQRDLSQILLPLTESGMVDFGKGTSNMDVEEFVGRITQALMADTPPHLQDDVEIKVFVQPPHILSIQPPATETPTPLPTVTSTAEPTVDPHWQPLPVQQYEIAYGVTRNDIPQPSSVLLEVFAETGENIEYYTFTNPGEKLEKLKQMYANPATSAEELSRARNELQNDVSWVTFANFFYPTSNELHPEMEKQTLKRGRLQFSVIGSELGNRSETFFVQDPVTNLYSLITVTKTSVDNSRIIAQDAAGQDIPSVSQSLYDMMRLHIAQVTGDESQHFTNGFYILPQGYQSAITGVEWARTDGHLNSIHHIEPSVKGFALDEQGSFYPIDLITGMYAWGAEIYTDPSGQLFVVGQIHSSSLRRYYATQEQIMKLEQSLNSIPHTTPTGYYTIAVPLNNAAALSYDVEFPAQDLSPRPQFEAPNLTTTPTP